MNAIEVLACDAERFNQTIPNALCKRAREINQQVIGEAFDYSMNVDQENPCTPVNCFQRMVWIGCEECPLCDHGKVLNDGSYADSIHCLKTTGEVTPC